VYDVLVGSAKVSKEQSFFVGDALGGKGDWADSDKVFAQNIGFKCYSPEKMFAPKQETVEISGVNLSDAKQVVIMVGYPGSGKSTIAKKICEDENFVLVQGDVHKTSPKMIKAALPSVKEGKSVVFDATNSSSKKRSEYIDFAKKHNLKVVCIHMTTSLEVSYKRNKERDPENQVPKIAPNSATHIAPVPLTAAFAAPLEPSVATPMTTPVTKNCFAIMSPNILAFLTMFTSAA
jgi:bifunctional polynucleotide phosphatase/kinase